MTRNLIHRGQKQASVGSAKAEMTVKIQVPLGRRAVIASVNTHATNDNMWSKIDQGTPTRYLIKRKIWERRERRIGA